MTPGQTLFIAVGGNGATSIVPAFNGGGAGAASGGHVSGGGGASDIRICSRNAACPALGSGQDPRLVVAGGGGGGGQAPPAPDPPPPGAYFSSTLSVSSTLSALPISQNVGAHRPTKIANR